jgi:hypothetical protein
MERSRSSLTLPDETRQKVERLTERVEHGIDFTTFHDWHVIGTAGEPAFQNSWVNFNATADQFAAFWKDSAGIIRLRGIIKTGAVPSVAFTLPAGFRPAGLRRFAVSSAAAFGQVDVDPTGTVSPVIGSSTWVSLDGISFRTEK